MQYKEILFYSLIEGSGKTTAASYFADKFAKDGKKIIISDYNVFAPAMHHFHKPVSSKQEDFTGQKAAVINQDLCIHCAMCQEACKFNAIENIVDFEVNEYRCDGCGECTEACPLDGIELVPKISGQMFIAETAAGPLIYGKMTPGTDNPEKLINIIKETTNKIASETKPDFVIIDGNPYSVEFKQNGTGNRPIKILIAEATERNYLSLLKMINNTAPINLPNYIIINKKGIKGSFSDKLREVTKMKNLFVLGGIAYTNELKENYLKGIPDTENAELEKIYQEFKSKITSKTITKL